MNTNERIPLYQKIQEYIINLIESKDLNPGDRIPTEKELMETFHVSKITVVNALTGLANDRIITRVPGRGSFVSELEASADSEAVRPAAALFDEKGEDIGSRPLIGIIMPTISDYFAIRLIEGIQMMLDKRGCRGMILLSGGKLEKEKDAIDALKAYGAEGLLIFPVDEEKYNEEILSMKLDGYPFVLIDRYLPGVETHYIAADGRLGTKLAVDHLWELGHREIAICSDSPLATVTVQERLEGYMNALKDNGSMINPAHMITDFSIQSLTDAEQHPLYRYIRNRMASAYITLNGRLGVLIYQLARQAGLRVPEDLSIVSFDDPTSIVEEFSIFTHINQREREMGRRAAEKLLQVIDGQADSVFRKELLEPQLIIRQTTGPVESSKP